jgi:hypothetical protein
MNRLKLILISGVLLLLAGCGSDSAIDLVKNGNMDNCPQKTLGQMANDYMDSPSWESLVADDGLTYVNLRGGITYDGIPVTALVQFLVNENTNRFEINALEINNLPQNMFMAIGLLNNMCQA